METEFLIKLEEKAKEQRKLLGTEIIPEWARGMADWLAVHPWRVLIPLSVTGYFLLRVIVGASMRELMLGLFGGFPR